MSPACRGAHHEDVADHLHALVVVLPAQPQLAQEPLPLRSLHLGGAKSGSSHCDCTLHPPSQAGGTCSTRQAAMAHPALHTIPCLTLSWLHG